MKRLIGILVTVSLTACHEQHSEQKSAPDPNASTMAVDLDSDPQVTIMKADSMSAVISIGSDNFNGEQWTEYKFDCSGASIERVLKFLYMEDNGKTPKIIGYDILPDSQFRIDFGDRRWKSKDDAREDIKNAIQRAFKVTINYNAAAKSVIVQKRDKEP